MDGRVNGRVGRAPPSVRRGVAPQCCVARTFPSGKLHPSPSPVIPKGRSPEEPHESRRAVAVNKVACALNPKNLPLPVQNSQLQPENRDSPDLSSHPLPTLILANPGTLPVRKSAMSHSVCPWWLGYFLLNPFRRMGPDPTTILAPYVRPGMTVLEPGPGMGFSLLISPSWWDRPAM